MKLNKEITSFFTISQQDCQKAKEKPFGPGALSPLKLARTANRQKKKKRRNKKVMKGTVAMKVKKIARKGLEYSSKL